MLLTSRRFEAQLGVSGRRVQGWSLEARRAEMELEARRVEGVGAGPVRDGRDGRDGVGVWRWIWRRFGA
jgi:hypothetical protein